MTKLITALDTTDLEQALAWSAAVKPYAACVKVGLELFYAHGHAGMQKIAATGTPIFLDLKLHDIPNTVAGGLKGLLPLKPAMLTLHTLGGKAMMETVSRAADASGHRPLVLGVTILTSMDENELSNIGLATPIIDRVRQLAGLALKSGMDGIVCSAHELPIIRKEFGDALKTIVPGIRPAGAEKGDQSRIMTPKEASQNGADYIVVGRPITQSADPAGAAKAIAADL